MGLIMVQMAAQVSCRVQRWITALTLNKPFLQLDIPQSV
jgi:hypothetical protein